MDRHRRAWLIAIILSTANVGMTLAGPRVVVVESPDHVPLPALAAQVALHAGPAVSITTVRQLVSDVAMFAEVAPQILRRHDATLVVWIEAPTDPSAGPRTFSVYVVGHTDDRALLELVRIAATTPGSEVERTIALKIGALLDSLLATPAGAALGVSSPTRSRWTIELGAVTGIEGGDRELVAGPRLALVRSWEVGGWRIAARGTSRWLLASTIENLGARTKIDDVGAFVGGSIERASGRWSGSASTHVGVAIVSASATRMDGRFGSAIVGVPVVGLGVGGRLRVSGQTSLGLTLDLERTLIHQRFLAEGNVIAELGSTRVIAGLDLSMPIR